ncbi:MAG: phosphatidate cytidylyltransferase [Pirellulaceae bacterium]|nr:MAG: phosphatidate cytidylyltransferase [Pirellulaceae bacterium]
MSELSLRTKWILGILLGTVAVLYVVGRVLRQQPEGTVNPALVRRFNERVRIWWLMLAILAMAMWLGTEFCLLLFLGVSFWALREFITMTPTRPADHRALFWVFFLFTPLQYLLIGLGRKYYDLYSVLIPVYASLFIPARIAISGDPKRFLERSAKIQVGLLICVYAFSFAPALLTLEFDKSKWHGSNEELLLYFVVLVQLNDLFQFGWGKLLGRHVIAPAINASRTWEGMIGGIVSSTLLGILMWWMTPFQMWEAGLITMATCLAGFAGGMTMSAIKRDRGVSDYGTLVRGHAGLLDRIDSLCFAAPVFFHLARLYQVSPAN